LHNRELGTIQDRTVRRYGRRYWEKHREEIYAMANKRGGLERWHSELYKQADRALVSKLVANDIKKVFDEIMKDERKLFWIDDVRRILGKGITEFFSSSIVVVEEKGVFVHITESLLDSQIKNLAEVSDSLEYGLYKYAYFWNTFKAFK
jgi:hypothetical protein